MAKTPKQKLLERASKPVENPDNYKVGPGKPPLHSRFKPGNNANPLGCAASPVKQALRKLTAQEFESVITMALTGDLEALKAVASDKSSSAMKIGVATALANAIKKGDWNTLQSIVERVIGKQVVRTDITTGGKPIDIPTKVVLYLPKNGRTKEEN